MSRLTEMYYSTVAAAYLRGLVLSGRAEGGVVRSIDPEVNGRSFTLPSELTTPPLDTLSEEEIERILERGEAAKFKLYRFKNTHDDLPRVRRVLGFLRSFCFDTLLDVGSGRGVFLWTFLTAFPTAKVTAVDLLTQWGELYDVVRAGGMDRLHGHVGEFEKIGYPDKSFDVVSLLEVLEHIPDYNRAIREAVRLARRHIVVSVPSKPDDNPAHIHLLTKEILTDSFTNAGVERLKFDGVNGCLILFATLKP